MLKQKVEILTYECYFAASHMTAVFRLRSLCGRRRLRVCAIFLLLGFTHEGWGASGSIRPSLSPGGNWLAMLGGWVYAIDGKRRLGGQCKATRQTWFFFSSIIKRQSCCLPRLLFALFRNRAGELVKADLHEAHRWLRICCLCGLACCLEGRLRACFGRDL
jgi:hypothetical protein